MHGLMLQFVIKILRTNNMLETNMQSGHFYAINTCLHDELP